MHKTTKLDDEVKTFYLYRTEYPKKVGSVKISETPIKMEKWRDVNDTTPARILRDYYKPAANQNISVAPISVDEIGTMYHGTDMILEKPDKDYYIKALIEYYDNNIHTFQKLIDTYKDYIRCAKIMRGMFDYD